MTRVALIDGPLPVGLFGCVSLLDANEDAVLESPAGRHAAAVAGVIHARAPRASIFSIPVFKGSLSARVTDLVDALRLAVESEADIVHCSLGIARNDPSVAESIRALTGRIVVASAPARGASVWPATLPTVISVQGDARCGPGQWSVLDLPAADFGACPQSQDCVGIAGASIAAANMTGILALRAIPDEAAARAFLRNVATYQGRENRRNLD